MLLTLCEWSRLQLERRTTNTLSLQSPTAKMAMIHVAYSSLTESLGEGDRGSKIIIIVVVCLMRFTDKMIVCNHLCHKAES